MNYQHKAIELDLTCIQIESLEMAARFNQGIWEKMVESAPRRVFTEYELAVIGYYNRFGFVPSADKHIISNYKTQLVESSDRNRSPPSKPDGITLEPEVNIPEYPFQNFNYGP
jgi:hypothetical protein